MVRFCPNFSFLSILRSTGSVSEWKMNSFNVSYLFHLYFHLTIIMCFIIWSPRANFTVCMCFTFCLYCIEFPSHSQSSKQSVVIAKYSRSKAFSIALYKLNLCSECHLSFHNINLNEHINHNMENTQIKCQFDVKGTRTSMAKKWANSKSLLLRCCFILTGIVLEHI